MRHAERSAPESASRLTDRRPKVTSPSSLVAGLTRARRPCPKVDHRTRLGRRLARRPCTGGALARHWGRRTVTHMGYRLRLSPRTAGWTMAVVVAAALLLLAVIPDTLPGMTPRELNMALAQLSKATGPPTYGLGHSAAGVDLDAI